MTAMNVREMILSINNAMDIGSTYTARKLSDLTGIHPSAIGQALTRMRDMGYVTSVGNVELERGKTVNVWKLQKKVDPIIVFTCPHCHGFGYTTVVHRAKSAETDNRMCILKAYANCRMCYGTGKWHDRRRHADG